MAGNPGTLGLGAVAGTPAMVSKLQCTGIMGGAGWNICSETVGTAYSAGDLRRYHLFNNWPEGLNKVGRAVECGFTRARTRLWGPNKPPLWYPQVAGLWSNSKIGMDRRFIGMYH